MIGAGKGSLSFHLLSMVWWVMVILVFQWLSMVGWVMLVQLAGGRLDMSAGGRRCRGVPPLRGGFFF